MQVLPDVRVGAAERDNAVEALSVHMVAGRLSMGEFEDRVDLAHAAVARADLQALFEDLPAPGPEFERKTVPAPEAEAALVGQGAAGSAAPRGPKERAARAAYALFPASGAISLGLTALTHSGAWLLLLPPIAYGARRFTRKWRPQD
ncbi:DUF1707 domain-containing protein [Kitasatospora sp. NPDC052896]|uniref:DUF1707 domain-containing protein n=1 Tax=Kitasatospora sp. NPDC052896 TaxID=3364061 RepID=UPI0037C6C839